MTNQTTAAEWAAQIAEAEARLAQLHADRTRQLQNAIDAKNNYHELVNTRGALVLSGAPAKQLTTNQQAAADFKLHSEDAGLAVEELDRHIHALAEPLLALTKQHAAAEHAEARARELTHLSALDEAEQAAKAKRALYNQAHADRMVAEEHLTNLVGKHSGGYVAQLIAKWTRRASVVDRSRPERRMNNGVMISPALGADGLPVRVAN